MPYPGRKIYDPLPEFVGTAVIKPSAAQRARLIEYVCTEYRAGRLIHELRKLTDRSKTAVRRALADGGVRLRGRGAPPAARAQHG